MSLKVILFLVFILDTGFFACLNIKLENINNKIKLKKNKKQRLKNYFTFEIYRYKNKLSLNGTKKNRGN